MLGVWLTMTPFVFRLEQPSVWQLEVMVGIAVMVLSLLSFWERTEWAHWVTLGLAVAFGLFAWSWFERPGPPLAQNDILVALLIATFAILPNHIFMPPRAWREFEARRSTRQ
jgi:hypothetical protein